MSEKAYTGRKWFGLSGTKLSQMIGFAAGAGFLLFGYDQGVMGSLLTLRPFQEQFPDIDTSGTTPTGRESTLQGVTIGIYEIGCFLGAISCLWLGDMLGRRKIIWIGTVWMIVGAILQASSFSLAQLMVARVVSGIGNGMHTATIPVWQSECSPPHLRGKLVMIEGALITGGIALSYFIDLALYPARLSSSPSVAWRFPIAFQIVLCIPTLITIWMPESPRWLILKGNETEAREVMACLDELPLDDPTIDVRVNEIKESLELAAGVGVKDLFTFGPERNFHRTLLGFIIQMFQQISGINLITYYAGTIYENYLGFNAFQSRLLAAFNGLEYFMASWIAVYTIEKFGRRKLMLFGALGMSGSMAILGAMNSPAALNPDADGNAQNTAPAVVAAVFLFVFNSFFAVGWLGMTWLYPAEITPLSIRAAANGISTSSNWLFNFMVVLVTPIAFYNIGYKTYVTFAVINFGIFVTTYFIFPEVAGRSLEEMDGIFARASKINPFDVVRIEQETPRRYDKKGRLLDLDNILAEDGLRRRQTKEDEKVGGDADSSNSGNKEQ